MRVKAGVRLMHIVTEVPVMGIEKVLRSMYKNKCTMKSNTKKTKMQELLADDSPQRDRTEAACLVGFLSDQRHIDRQVSPSVPLSEVVLAACQDVRQQLWRAHSAATHMQIQKKHASKTNIQVSTHTHTTIKHTNA